MKADISHPILRSLSKWQNRDKSLQQNPLLINYHAIQTTGPYAAVWPSVAELISNIKTLYVVQTLYLYTCVKKVNSCT